MSLPEPLLKGPGLAHRVAGQSRLRGAEDAGPPNAALESSRVRPLRGVRIVACLHVTTETANLCNVVIQGGAGRALCAFNPLSAKDDVAAAVARERGASVPAISGCDQETFYRQVRAALAIGPNLVLDGGGDLTVTLHREYQKTLPAIVGETEITSTGVVRLSPSARHLNGPMQLLGRQVLDVGGV